MDIIEHLTSRTDPLERALKPVVGRLGWIACHTGTLERRKLAAALAEQPDGVPLGEWLITLGHVSERRLDGLLRLQRTWRSLVEALGLRTECAIELGARLSARNRFELSSLRYALMPELADDELRGVLRDFAAAPAA